MNRKFSLGRVHHPFGSYHGKLPKHVVFRRAIGIAIVVAGWTFFLTGWLDSAAPSTPGSTQLVQQMIWNPSPK